MGCLHIALGDRFNEQLQEIYRIALQFLLSQMAHIYDELSERASTSSEEHDKDSSPDSNNAHGGKASYLRPLSESEKSSPGEDINERFNKMNIFAEKYQE